MPSNEPAQETALDPEWIELIFLAKTIGFTLEEVRSFLTNNNNQE